MPHKDEEDADIEGSALNSGSMLETLGTEYAVIDLEWPPEDEGPRNLEKADPNLLTQSRNWFWKPLNSPVGTKHLGGWIWDFIS